MTWKNETTGQRLPAPLPMYEPVRLKHVPTFVRRRYDRDIKAIHDANEGLSSEESRSNGDGVEDDDSPSSVVTDFDDGVDKNEMEDDTHYSSGDDFNNSNNESNSSTYDGSYSKDNIEADDEVAEDVEFVSSVDASIENDVHDNKQGSNSKDKIDEVDEFGDDAILIDYVVAIVKDEVQDNEKVQNNKHEHEKFDDEQGMQIVQSPNESKLKDDKGQDANDLSSDVVASVEDDEAEHGILASCNENGGVDQDEVQDNKRGNLSNERGLLEEDDKSDSDEGEVIINDVIALEYDSVGNELENVGQADFDTKHDTQTNTAEDVDNYKFQSSASIRSENKCEGEIQHKDGASSLKASVEDNIQHHGHENSYINNRGLCSKDFEEEEDEANDVNLEGYGDTSMNSGAQHKKGGLHMEDCKTEVDGKINTNIQ